MVKDIYEQHATAFKGISAYVLLYKGKSVGKIAFKRGNCRCYAYAHILGLKMTKGQANGGGYDMASAALNSAFHRNFETKHDQSDSMYDAQSHILKIRAALKDDGRNWDNALRDSGYEVIAAI